MILSKGCGCNTAGTVNGSISCTNAEGECDCKNTFFGNKCAEGILCTIEYTVQFYILSLTWNLPI